MSKTKEAIYGVLKGRFLVDEDAQKNWGFLVFLTFLALLMIASSHQVDRKVQEIAALNKKNRELRAEFVSTRSELMKLKMESNINKVLEKNGFYSYLNPPVKLKIKIEEE